MGTVAHLVVKVSANTGDFDKQLRGVETAWKRTGAKLQTMGADLTKAVTLPLALFSGLAIKAAADFESSFAGIRKTVDTTEQGFAALAAGMREMATQIPVSVNELNRIGELGGQLGIQTDNLLDFTRVVAAMGVTTNLSTEEAAMGMARFANITQMSQKDFSRLGSTFVALGNDVATTEKDILEFSLRIAGAGEIAGLTEAQILGIGAAMSAVGVEAEAGGTAVQKVLLQMVEAVNTHSQDLARFGSAAGMSGSAFASLFQANPGEAFTQFVEGIGEAGQGAINILSGLGLDDQRLIKSFLSLAGAGDQLRTAIDLANKGWTENVALTKEAQERYKTFSSQVTILKNQIYDFAITIGTELIESIKRMLPALETVLSGVAGAVRWFSQLPESVQTATFGFFAFAAALGPLAYMFGSVMKAGAALIGVVRMLPFATMASSATTATAGIKGMTGAMGGTTAAATTLSTTVMGLGAAVAVAGAAWAGWNIGRWIDEHSGLSNMLGQWIAQLGELVGLLPEGSGAAGQSYREAARMAKLNAGARGGADVVLPADPDSLMARGSAVGAIFTSAGVTMTQALTEAQKKAAEAAKQHATELRQLRDELSGAAAIAAATDMAEALGFVAIGPSVVDMKTLVPDMRERVHDVMGDAIQALRAQSKAIPPIIQQAFDASTWTKVDLSGLEFLSDYETFVRELETADSVHQALSGLDTPLPFTKVDMAPLQEYQDWLAGTTERALETTAAFAELAARERELSQRRHVQGLLSIAGALDQVAQSSHGALGAFAAMGAQLTGAFAARTRRSDETEGDYWNRLAIGEQGFLRMTRPSVDGQPITGGERAMGAAQLATAAISAYSQLIQIDAATKQGSRGDRMLTGMQMGAAAGSNFGPYGTMVGAGVGLAIGANNDPAIQGAEVARAFSDALVDRFDQNATAQQAALAGGERITKMQMTIVEAYEAVGETGERAFRDIAAVQDMARVGSEATEHAIKRITDVFERQQQLTDAQAQKQDMLNAAVERYGFTFAQAGQIIQRQQLAKHAEQLIQDWQLLTEAGVSVAIVADQMAASTSLFVQGAIASGTEVPEAMRPMLDAMIQQRVLTDAAGVAFTSLQATGLQFGDQLESMFERVLEKLELLIERLQTPLPDISPEMANRTPSILGEYTGTTPVARSFANEGVVSRPTLAIIGDAPEPEYVLRRSTVMSLQGGGQGARGSQAPIQFHIDQVVTTGDPREFVSRLRTSLRRNEGGILSDVRALVGPLQTPEN